MSAPLMLGEVWLPLHTLPSGATTHVRVDYETYCSLSRRDLARLYRQHVPGASRSEARRWARRQAWQRTLPLRRAT